MKNFCLSLNKTSYSHFLSTKKLGKSFCLPSFLDKCSEPLKWYWKDKKGREKAAVGSLLSFTSPPVFDLENTSPARIWGGKSFFSNPFPKDTHWSFFPTSYFFLPQYEITQEQETFYLISHGIDSLPLPLEEDLSLSSSLPSQLLSKQLAEHMPDEKSWHALVGNCLEKIQTSSLEKVVLARRTTFALNAPLSPFLLLLQAHAKNATCFAVQFAPGQTFIGATPEHLYKRSKQNVSTEAIAGTTCQGKTKQEDLLLRKQLLLSAKDRKELEYVKLSLQQKLSPLCYSYEQSKNGLLSTGNLHHLHSQIKAVLHYNTSDKDLLEALHPTAAIGGNPSSLALDYLKAFEPIERGWYSAPIGYMTAQKAEFIVAIRSLLIQKQALHLFAAAGIVEGSYPDKEWEELEHKIGLWSFLWK